jgi:hypothetical protein
MAVLLRTTTDCVGLQHVRIATVAIVGWKSEALSTCTCCGISDFDGCATGVTVEGAALFHPTASRNHGNFLHTLLPTYLSFSHG